MSRRGQLIVFEGVDGVGKSTLSKAVAKEKASQQQRCEWHAFPGRTPGTVGALIYGIHHHPASFGVHQITASSLQTLHIAAHLDAIETVIIPALKDGKDIVLDRFWWSTWVYGVVGQVNPLLLQRLIDVEKSAWGEFLPSAAFLITRDRPFTHDRMDAWSALGESYRQLIVQESQRYPIHVIENHGTIEDSVRRILALLQ